MYRVTVFLPTPTSLAVESVPHPSRIWSSTASVLSKGSLEPTKAVPVRSEKRPRHVRHRIIRMAFLCPLHPSNFRFPRPRIPRSGHSIFWQQKSSIDRIVLLLASQPLVSQTVDICHDYRPTRTEDSNHLGIPPEIPGAAYLEYDSDDDGELEDCIWIGERQSGNYQIAVIANPEASPTDTYSLEIAGIGESLNLAQNIPIGSTPRQPYLISSTESGLHPVIAQSIDGLVGVTVGRAALDAKTGQFSVNVTVKNKSSIVIARPVWLVIDSVSNFWVTPVHTSGTTLDGKPYIDLSGLLGDGKLDPGETVTQRLSFSNPSRVSFTFKSSVRGVVSP